MKQIISIENNNFDTWQRWSQIKMLHTLSPLLYIYSKQINNNVNVKLIGYFIYLKKNPAYGRQSISQPIGILAPMP